LTDTTEFYFKGKIFWAFVHKTDKYDKYSFNFVPEDAEVRKAVKATGVRNGIKEDKDGNLFYKFRRDAKDGPIYVTDPEGKPIESLIGNGSDVVVKLGVEKFVSPTHGPVVRSKVLGVVVTNLIPYEKKEAAPDPDRPVAEKPAGMPF
jgi:hypothetical protein